MALLRPILSKATPLLANSRAGTSLSARFDLRSNGATITKNENGERIEERDIVTEASESYLAYAMSVIVGRALPDVRDGLKPVHRRILYGMHELRMGAEKPFKKCARVVGEVLGKYHPHGDSAVYSALVRMAQDFSLRYPLINGHGNFGSLDDDPPAAMRYTECKLRGISGDMLLDNLEEQTVDFMDTFDGSHVEPQVFPAKVPNLLINGSSGIAVGVATRIPPHNMSEVIQALEALIENPDITTTELMQYIPAPDFPTGGEILLNSRLNNAYETGNGTVVVRGTVQIEEENTKPSRRRRQSRNAIVITELPYLTNKARFVGHVAALVESQALEGISDVLDESDRDGMRIVIEIKRGWNPNIVLNNLYRQTALQSRFCCNMVALVNGKPEMVTLKQMLSHFLDFRIDVIKRRTQFQLEKAKTRLVVVVGLLKALDHVDEVVTLLKQSSGLAQARQNLRDRFELTEEQAAAVASMPLSRLTIQEVQKLREEQTELTKLSSQLETLLASDSKILKLIQNEANQIERHHGDKRRSRLIEDIGDLTDMDIIPNHPMIITYSRKGFIKRMLPDTFSVQKRGGKGVHGAKMRGDDTMNEILHVMAHDQVLFFASDGRVFCLRAYEIPQSSRTATGTSIAQVLPGLKDAQITSIFTIGAKMETEGKSLLLVTKKGRIKRTPLELFRKIRSNGLMATRLVEGDELRFVQIGTDDSSVLMASDKGRICRFNLDKLRTYSRTAKGIKGLNVHDGEVVGMAVLPHGDESDLPEEPEEIPEGELPEEESLDVSPSTAAAEISLLMVTENGLGKRVRSVDFPTKNRAGIGNIGIRLKPEDKLVGLLLVSPDAGHQELMLASEQGMMTRIRADEVSQQSRYAKGVKVMNMNEGDRVTSVATVMEADTDF